MLFLTRLPAFCYASTLFEPCIWPALDSCPVNTLNIRLVSISGQDLHVDETVDVDSIRPEGATDVPAEAVRIVGDLTPVGEDYLFQGNLEAEFVDECDRCLQAASERVTVPLCWNFERDPVGAMREAGIELDSEDDLEDSAIARPIVNEEIALGPHVWEELALSVPGKFVCREDCRGLCPVCGLNLNETTCNCEKAASPGIEQIRGLAGLAEKFPELAPKNTTEE